MSEVVVNFDPWEWDQELAALGGHPWQSAHWGEAQREVENIEDLRLLAREGGEIKQMLRVERRDVRGLGRVAWIRRGPTGSDAVLNGLPLVPELAAWLKGQGFFVAIASPWCQPETLGEQATANDSNPRTIWVDLSGGRQAVWNNLTAKWRQNVRRARVEGVTIETTQDRARIEQYYALCRHISQVKGFALRTSPDLMEKLVSGDSEAPAETKLFIAICDDQIAAGALISRCGRSIHYFGGATNREFSIRRPAEALHWSIMEWALSKGCTRYELEGIDPEGNPGVYAFKKKMGGEEVILVPRQIEPLNIVGRAVAPMARTVLNSDLAALPALGRAAFSR